MIWWMKESCFLYNDMVHIDKKLRVWHTFMFFPAVLICTKHKAYSGYCKWNGYLAQGTRSFHFVISVSKYHRQLSLDSLLLPVPRFPDLHLPYCRLGLFPASLSLCLHPFLWRCLSTRSPRMSGCRTLICRLSAVLPFQ